MKEILKLDHIQKYYGNGGNVTKAIQDVYKRQGALTFREFEIVGNQTLQSLKRPEENALHLSFHLLGEVRVIHSSEMCIRDSTSPL